MPAVIAPSLPNYLVGHANPFHLAGPPTYWLQALWDFDQSLVVMPSKTGFFYRVCQRRRPTHATKIVNDILKEDADARMMAAKNLVPVTTLLATTNWADAPRHMEELRQRCPHRLGGAEKVNSLLEAQDQAKELGKAALTDAMLTDLSKDGWGLYLKKLGLRSHMWVPKTPGSAAPLVPHAKKAPAIQVGSIFLP